MPPDPDVFIVTSNWHPREIWGDEKTLLPILRRFKVTHFGAGAKLFREDNQHQ
jgi:hypothetical protein